MLDPLAALVDIDDADAFASLVSSDPRILSDEVLASLAPLQDSPAGPSVTLVISLLQEARRDPVAAFTAYQEELEAQRPLMESFEKSCDVFYAELKAGRFDDAVPHGEAALEVAIETGQVVMIVLLRHDLGKALSQCRAGNRSEQIDEGIGHLEAAGPLAFTDELRASIRADLGALWGQRVAGDPSENRAIAMALTRQALVDLGESTDATLRATIEANLAHALSATPHSIVATSRREGIDAARRAVANADLAVDPKHWAHCQINLGASLMAGYDAGEVEPGEVMAAFQPVVEALREGRESWLAGFAAKSIARVMRRETAGPEDGFADVVATLTEAVDLIGEQNDLVRGQALIDLGDAQWKLGERVSARAAFEEAMVMLPLSVSPTDRRDAAFRLGGLLVELGDDELASGAYAEAIEAAEVSFHARLQLSGREQETLSAARLYRWAAAAFHRTGAEARAVEALEAGRARELRRRLEPSRTFVDELDGVPAETRAAYVDAVARLRTEPLRAPDNEASRDLGRALAEIRAVPGYEGFAVSSSIGQIAAGAAPGWPLLYINPAPGGTSLLAVTESCAVSSRLLDEPTSGEVWQMLTGRDLSGLDETPHPDSYLACASGQGSAGQLQSALDELCAWLGERIGPAIIELAEELDAEGFTIISCGPLSIAPLAVIEAPGVGLLIDRLGTRFAPSAAVMSACRARSGRERERRLTALVGPGLAAAEPEVRAIAALFENREVGLGDEATASFLAESGPGASHVHISSHGQGGLHGFHDSWVELADGKLSADRIAALPLAAEVAVVSACQTGAAQPGELGDESYSLASSLLAAGATCAIAGLWSVPDSVTALLMVRFYEELKDGCSAPDALRRAQCWIRDAELADCDELAVRNPELQEVVDRMRARGAPASRPLFAGSFAWAAFCAFGV